VGRKATIKFEYNGELLTIPELMRYSVVDKHVLRRRLANDAGNIVDALNKPLGVYKKDKSPSKGSVERANRRNGRKRPSILSHPVQEADVRSVGELPISSMGVPASTPLRTQYYCSKQKKLIQCKGCGKDLYIPVSMIRAQSKDVRKDGFFCYPCREKSKNEVQDAIKALNMRKYLASKGK